MCTSNKDKDKINLITTYIEKSKTKTPKKGTSSALSPAEKEHQNKKANMSAMERDNDNTPNQI